MKNQSSVASASKPMGGRDVLLAHSSTTSHRLDPPAEQCFWRTAQQTLTTYRNQPTQISTQGLEPPTSGVVYERAHSMRLGTQFYNIFPRPSPPERSIGYSRSPAGLFLPAAPPTFNFKAFDWFGRGQSSAKVWYTQMILSRTPN